MLAAFGIVPTQVMAATKTKQAKTKKEVQQKETSKETESTEPTEEASEPAHDVGAVGQLPSLNESWYTLWGLGFSKNQIEDENGNNFFQGTSRNTSYNLDLLGFYWPINNHKTMLGFIINTTSDSGKDSAGITWSVVTSQLGFSAQHFFGTNIGDGPFIRGDLGFTRAASEARKGGNSFTADTNSKGSFLIGGGYAWPLSQETRLLLGLYYRYLPDLKYDGYVDHVKGRIINLTAGFLF